MANWTFAGWYLDKECTLKYDFSTPVAEDMVLYGKWLYTAPETPTPETPTTPDSGKGAPETGDSTNLNIMIMLLAISGSLSLLLVGKRKKLSDS